MMDRQKRVGTRRRVAVLVSDFHEQNKQMVRRRYGWEVGIGKEERVINIHVNKA